MGDKMTFPETWEEYEKSYMIIDKEKVYTNGSVLIPCFRVKQWLDHLENTKNKQQIKSNEMYVHVGRGRIVPERSKHIAKEEL